MIEALRYNLKHNRRGLMKTATAWFLFGAIIVVFIFWGMSPRMNGAANVAEGGAAVVVNDATISLAQFGDLYERMRQDPRFEQFQSLGGDLGRQIIQNQVLQQLIQVELLRQQTEKQGIMTSDVEVRDIITGIPQFQEAGRFKRELYMGYLKATRKTPSEFEEDIRKQQSVRRSVSLFGAALRPMSKELEMQKIVSSQKTALDYLSIATDSLVKPSAITAAAAKAFGSDAANEGKIKSYFDSHKSQFSEEEKIHARHILIKARAGDAAAEQAAKTKIEGIAKQAKNADFAKLAKEFSEDPGSQANGGDLGFFARGRMVKAFEDAAFSAAPNEITAPIKTDYGYHLIQVLEKKPATTRTLDEAREEIARSVLAQEGSQKALTKLQDILKNGDVAALAAFVTENGLKWEETGSFGVDADSIPKIGANDQALQVAFTLNAQKPLAHELVHEGATAFVLRYKDVNAGQKVKEDKSAEKPEVAAEMLAGRRGEEALGNWIKQLEKTATISINPRFQGSQNQ
jgi:peptidyl-prolyl cis-trans isomerase D